MSKIKIANLEAASKLAEALRENMIEMKKNDFFTAFQEYFKDRAGFDSCLKSLKEDEDRIIELGFFYNLVTNEIGHAGITLISLFSIMEAVSKERFQPFDQWLLSKIKRDTSISFPIVDRGNFKETILSYQKKYFKKHGSAEKVRKFINQYFSMEDKKILIKSFKVKNKSIDFESLSFERQVKEIVKMLYNERNAFVHQGRLPQLTDRQDKMIGYFKIKNKTTYVSIEISIIKIQKMFERAFMKFLGQTCA